MKKILLGLFLIGSALSFSAERVIKMEEAFVDNNDIIYVQGEKTPFTGVIEDYKAYLGEGLLEGKVPFKDGKLKLEALYKDGNRDGITKSYYPNGKVQLEVNFKSGQLDGVLKKFDENGKLINQETYQNGNKIN